MVECYIAFYVKAVFDFTWCVCACLRIEHLYMNIIYFFGEISFYFIDFSFYLKTTCLANFHLPSYYQNINHLKIVHSFFYTGQDDNTVQNLNSVIDCVTTGQYLKIDYNFLIKGRNFRGRYFRGIYFRENKFREMNHLWVDREKIPRN